MSSSPPTTLGKYQIIREIARSNDIVYEAYDPLMNRRVAIKELAMPVGANSAQQEDRIKRFLREARAAGSLTHPNIMTVFEVGEDGDKHFIAMEYLDGHTLRNEIDTKGFLPSDEAVEIAKKVLSGLEYAHSKGVIHRDIKPDNIQLLTDGSIKLTDFGIARLTFEPNLTMDGQVFGTPSYMSPEQVVGRDIDARSDLFSMGVVLYEMIAGQKPFAGDSVVSITYAIMNKEPERPNQANFALWQVIETALDKSPQLRYANAHDMIEALDNAQKAVQPGSMVIDPGKPQIGGTLYQPGAGYYAQPQPPMGNPYAQPAPPPVVFPYNPYQQPGLGGQVAPHTPGFTQPTGLPPGFAPPGQMPPGYAQAPVYYPPPPRQPLLKPETKFFLGRMLLTVMVITMFVLVLLFGVNSLAKLATSGPPPAASPAPTGPIDAQIAQQQAAVAKSADQAERATRQKQLADMLEKKGLQQMASGQEQQGEANLLEAISNDPARASAYSELATSYQNKAAGTQDPNRKIELLQGAADNWASASEKELDPQRAQNFKQYAAQNYYGLGQALAEQNQRSDARDFLRKGLHLAPEGSPLARDITDLLNKLTAPS